MKAGVGAALAAVWLATAAGAAEIPARPGAVAPAPPPSGTTTTGIPLGVALYDNAGTGSLLYYGGQGGNEALDDLHLTRGGALDQLVLEYHDPASGAPFSATVRIFDNPDGLDLGVGALLGTYTVTGLPRGRQTIVIPLPDAPVAGAHVWVGVRFSSSTAGWVIHDVPAVGSSHDLYFENDSFFNFGGSPRANFAVRVLDVPEHALTVTIDGSGTVGRNPDRATYLDGSPVVLTATPSAHWSFTGWSGDASGTTNPLELAMTGPRAVTAHFAIDTYTLSYAAGANGTIDGAASQVVPHGGSGSAVTAVADAGHHFTSWSDGVTTATRTDANVTASLSVTASFAPDLVRVGGTGFESGLAGWKISGSGSLTLGAAGSGRAPSAYAARVAASSTSEFGINDSPPLVADTGPAGTRYRISAWVRSDLGRGAARIRVREYRNGSSQQSLYSPVRTLSAAWQQLVVEIVTRTSNAEFDVQILDRPSGPGEVFFIDDIAAETVPPRDRPPVVTAPTAATALAGTTLHVDVTAADPDGQPITSLSASSFAATHPPSFTAAPGFASGRLSWLPTAAEVGNTYTVTFTAQNALTGTATTTITVAAPPPPSTNLCGNGTFETDLRGWEDSGDATLSRVAGGRLDGFAMQIRGRASSSSFGCADDPDWVPVVAGRNAVYRFSAWVRSDAHRGRARLRVYEYLDGDQVGSTAHSEILTLSPAWQKLTLDYVAREAGSSLGMRVTNTPVSSSVAETFLVEDVSIELVSTPVLAAQRREAPADAPEPTRPRAAPLAAAGGAAFTLYDNTGNPANVYYAAQGGAEAIDDVHLAASGVLDSLVFESYDPATGGTYAATAAIYANPSGLDLGAEPLAGPFMVEGIARGRARVAVPLPAAPAAGTHLWVGVRFTSATAGLVLHDTPVAGASHDLYLENGGFYWFGGSPKANFGIRLTGTPANVGAETPPQLALALAPRPHPFRAGGTFELAIPRAGPVRLDVLDLQGRVVRRLIDGVREAGRHAERWDAADARGRTLPAGIYFLRLEAGAAAVTRKVVLAR